MYVPHCFQIYFIFFFVCIFSLKQNNPYTKNFYRCIYVYIQFSLQLAISFCEDTLQLSRALPTLFHTWKHRSIFPLRDYKGRITNAESLSNFTLKYDDCYDTKSSLLLIVVISLQERPIETVILQSHRS